MTEKDDSHERRAAAHTEKLGSVFAGSAGVAEADGCPVRAVADPGVFRDPGSNRRWHMDHRARLFPLVLCVDSLPTGGSVPKHLLLRCPLGQRAVFWSIPLPGRLDAGRPAAGQPAGSSPYTVPIIVEARG